MGAAPNGRPDLSPPQSAFAALWGVALIGITFDLAFDLAYPAQAVLNPVALGYQDREDVFIWAAYFVFAEDKFGVLIAMLFGALCIASSQSSADRSSVRYYLGMAALLCVGLAHGAAYSANNLLGGLALAGLCLPLFSGLPSRALYAAAIGLVAVHVGGGMVMLGASVVDFYQGRTGTAAALFAERAYGADRPALADAIARSRDGRNEGVALNMGDLRKALAALVGTLPLNLAGLTLGMALWKDGLFAREWRTFRMQRLAGICAAIALPALIALAWWSSSAGFPGALVGATSVVLSAPFDVLIALTYAVLGAAFFDPAKPVTRGLAATGRAALTNYLIVSLLLSAIFASWGGGQFAELSRSEVLAVGLVLATAALLWSTLWLRTARTGPAEWLIAKLYGPIA